MAKRTITKGNDYGVFDSMRANRCKSQNGTKTRGFVERQKAADISQERNMSSYSCNEGGNRVEKTFLNRDLGSSYTPAHVVGYTVTRDCSHVIWKPHTPSRFARHGGTSSGAK